MLSYEDNERLVRVGPDTEMGRLMRLYWLPFLAARDVEADGQPYRVRLLGEDLVAFRDSSGRVGLVDHACPHRGAQMAFGRNEEDGLRCIYHGWKFGVDGRCLDMPAEPAGSAMPGRMRIKSYPVRERHGVLWTYMGPEAGNPPPLPDMEWNLVPEDQVVVTLRVQECNWLQALEGEIDSAHAAILHGRVDGGTVNQWRQAQDLMPSFECQQHDAGISIAARRKVGDEQNYVRVNQFLMPFWTLVPPQSQFPELSGHAWVPIDDEHTLCMMFSYHPSKTFYEKSRKVFKEGYNGRETGHASDHSFEQRPPTDPYHTYWSKFNRGNAYQFDYRSQVEKYKAGLPGLWVQDAACQSGVAPIYDRTREHLGTTDTGIARTRRFLLEALKRLATEQAEPVSVRQPELFMLRAISVTIPEGSDWMAAGRDLMRARLGEDFGYTP
ncbi:Rieske 2Fe-2S domain-containing protein [Pigmentiphaga sp. GD03639]|uniref:Rieske 2Fe-2S domain-containing protein n=1 Tax=Pigmentiphaga daeguensis TaxID=414049 RepID=A0ABN1CZY0_9BURK|nr:MULTISPECIES: Rieske 2Fe-2S domain-containing protein [unclassified Pigmentiphaga]MDH2239921.1 Rieske 2Fe-2S domain-containing protein [Pigmentiphaga sp. GD03639]OVZ59884.1 ring-hydroxylating oxygenase subunit alpha [Pigmentiphaga sp. NML030171]